MPPKAFKPPRPSTTAISKNLKPKSSIIRKSTGSTTTTPKARSTTQPMPKVKSQHKERTSGTSKAPRISGLPSLSPDSEDDPSNDPFASDSEVAPATTAIDSEDENEDDARSEGGEEQKEEERREGIPPDLLTRLLHENFKAEGTRLSKDANKAVGKYMEIFVREALARAAFARMEIEERGGVVGGGFLEVEDLEKLAPQLLMDF